MRRWEKAARAHPVTILRYLWKFLFLLIVPVIRGFLSALTGGFIAWLNGAWMDVLIVALIVALAVLKWRCFKYFMDIDTLYYTSGIFFQQETAIPIHRISALTVLRPFWLRPFGVARVRVDTLARAPGKADLELYLSAGEAEQLMTLRRAPAVEREDAAAEYRPGLRGIIFLSLFTSNSFLGIVFISTFISQAGKLLGRELNALLLVTFERLSRLIAFGLPPVLAGVALALVGGWLVAFAYNLLQAKNLYTRRTASTLHMGGGVLVERECSLLLEDLSFVDIRQSLLTRALGLYSVFVSGIGLGKDRADNPVVVPFSTRADALKKLRLLLPEYAPAERRLRPNAGAIFKFILVPLWPCALLPLGTVVAVWLLPGWATILRFAGFMLAIPAYWFLGVRLMDFCSSGAAKQGNYYTIRYSKRYYLHSVVFSADKIALVNLRQSILQRGDNKCDLVISTRAEGRATHHLRNLGWDEAAALFGAAGDGWSPADAGIPNWYERLFARAARLLRRARR